MPCRRFFLSQDMQRTDSLGVTTKIPRLSTGTTREFKTQRSRSTNSSVSDVFADEATTRSQAGLSMRGMKLRSEKNLNDDERRSAEAGSASKTPTDPFEVGGANADPTRLPPARGPGGARQGLWTGGC